jgi:hypothetical protein
MQLFDLSGDRSDLKRTPGDKRQNHGSSQYEIHARIDNLDWMARFEAHQEAAEYC